MKKHLTNKLITAVVLTLFSLGAIAQEKTNDSDDSELMEKKGFHFGFFIGPYWANKYTSNLYNGFGLDANGAQNEFSSSYMYNKIINEYGGGYGQYDQIAAALGPNVQNNTQWHFGASDMPQNMHYTIAFLVGLNGRYSMDKKNAIVLNVNASKLKIAGNFTIETDVPLTQNQLSGSQYVNTFDIVGSEQRLMFQFGYARICGDNPRLNFFLEGGLNATLAKFDKNFIVINNLKIDLTQNYIPPGSGYPTTSIYFPKHIGIGFGAFAGAGFNITMSPKWTIQLLYSPTYDKINIGVNPVYKLQHAAGIRCYYNF